MRWMGWGPPADEGKGHPIPLNSLNLIPSTAHIRCDRSADSSHPLKRQGCIMHHWSCCLQMLSWDFTAVWLTPQERQINCRDWRFWNCPKLSHWGATPTVSGIHLNPCYTWYDSSMNHYYEDAANWVDTLSQSGTLDQQVSGKAMVVQSQVMNCPVSDKSFIHHCCSSYPRLIVSLIPIV